jgi:hypothetical protein
MVYEGQRNNGLLKGMRHAEICQLVEIALLDIFGRTALDQLAPKIARLSRKKRLDLPPSLRNL